MVVMAMNLTGSFVKEIARHFQRLPMTIIEAITEIQSLMENDMVLARRIEDMRSNPMKRGKKEYPDYFCLIPLRPSLSVDYFSHWTIVK